MRTRPRLRRPGSSESRPSSAQGADDLVRPLRRAELEPLRELGQLGAARAIAATVGAVERVNTGVDGRPGRDRPGAAGDDRKVDAAAFDHDPVLAADEAEAKPETGIADPALA